VRHDGDTMTHPRAIEKLGANPCARHVTETEMDEFVARIRRTDNETKIVNEMNE